jgi:type IV secretion system protein VirB1
MIAPATLTLLLASCAPQVAPDTARALIATESAGNPFAIGVVGGALQRQPVNLAEALATTHALQAAGWDYSVGLAQINRRNFARQGLTRTTAFEPCANLGAMQRILAACLVRASRAPQRVPKPASQPDQAALRDGFSCYYSGNFVTGHQHGYVSRVLAAAHKHRYADRVSASPRASPVP